MLNPVSDKALGELRAILPSAVFREPAPHYFEEPRGLHTGQAAVVLAPADVTEVSAIVKCARSARMGILPYGGGTGLVAGQVATDGPAPILLSLERMRAIRDVYPDENVLIAEAGATLADVQSAAADADRLFPLSYASEGTARIGGALSVNSGGLSVLRYGTARDLCLGLEAVLPDGSIWHGLKRLRKDNTGYDLRNLMIGAEGTLGVITAASLRLYPRPAAYGTAMIAVRDPAAALALLGYAGAIFGETVSAFELMSGQGLRFLEEAGLAHRNPFATIPDWMILIEVGAARGADPAAGFEALFAAAHERGDASDGVIAHSDQQRADLWAIRETIPEANRLIGAVASHDVSLPLGAIAEFIEEGRQSIAGLDPALRLNAFGHLGDGNLHYNVFGPPGGKRSDFAHLKDDVTRRIHDLVAAHGGSFSAEHGIGRLKVSELERYGDPAKLAAMRAIKAALDPAGIMNPGAVLRAG